MFRCKAADYVAIQLRRSKLYKKEIPLGEELSAKLALIGTRLLFDPKPSLWHSASPQIFVTKPQLWPSVPLQIFGFMSAAKPLSIILDFKAASGLSNQILGLQLFNSRRSF